MKILVVEDMPDRCEWFRQRFPSDDLTFTDEPLVAIAHLERSPFDRLYLDHDLGKEPRAGRDVTLWLVRHPKILPHLQIVTHTSNHISGPKIKQECLAAGRPCKWRPFGDLVQELTA